MSVEFLIGGNVRKKVMFRADKARIEQEKAMKKAKAPAPRTKHQSIWEAAPKSMARSMRSTLGCSIMLGMLDSLPGGRR
ncbi:MAG TPA: hypothetical protein ENG92_06115 [Thiolapillus brandeum]|uniref:Uncharacterized protein n=1 Tax=Thiolapillus brandeum TaxID=1076588 RepID=A0A831NTY6_9GAMM|nr:hypothetical protein [Thiolapillus brandeum]